MEIAGVLNPQNQPTAWEKVVQHVGHVWTWISTKTINVWNGSCALVASVWAKTFPAFTNFASWVATYQIQVAIVVGLAVLGTLAARAIFSRCC